MIEFRKNKVHSVNLNITKKNFKEDFANCQYLRDYYYKDFSYISPEAYEGLPEDYLKNSETKEKSTCKLLFRQWLQEVLHGLKQFLYEGSLHGVKYIFEPTFSRKERATWIIIVVLSIAMCTGIIIQLFSKSNSTPFVNVIDSLPTPVWAIPFPSVVLCPHLHIQMSYVNVSELDRIHNFFASRVCPQMFRENTVLIERLNMEQNEMLQKFIVEGSPKCTDIVKTCYWRDNNQRSRWNSWECCEKFFKPLFTNYGLCFSFNGLPLNGMTNATLLWQRLFGHHMVPGTLEWGLDTGYPKVFPPNPKMIPYRVTASGESNGLGVELYLNTSERQFACDGTSMGFNVSNREVNKKLIISSPTDHVYTSTVLRLPMDRMTTIEVYPITYKTDSNLRALSPERRQCFFQNERKLLYYEFYTDNNCKHELLLLEAVRMCNCVLYNWPRRFIWEQICVTESDFRCIDEVKVNVEEQLIKAYFADSEEQRPASSLMPTSCHPSCNNILYSSQVFYSDLNKEARDLSEEWGHPGEGEVTRINVHFYDDMFLGQHRHAQYDDYYFVGAIGGLLSLFLGFSIISVAEIVYFVALRPLHIILNATLLRKT